MNDNICLVVNTVQKNSDLWPMFLDSIGTYFKDIPKIYFFTDSDLDKQLREHEVVYYSKEHLYREQFASCLKKVKEPYCIYVSEDYILYDQVDINKIKEFHEILKTESISFVRFMKSAINKEPLVEHSENLHYVPIEQEYFYTNQAALWKTNDLLKVHELGPNLHIGNEDWKNSFEFQATKTCRDLKLQGLFCHYGERKRGLYHYDSLVFPHISTALVKGKWNMTEYPVEMTKLIRKYKININKRGWV